MLCVHQRHFLFFLGTHSSLPHSQQGHSTELWPKEYRQNWCVEHIQALPIKSIAQSSSSSPLSHSHLKVNNQGKLESCTLEMADCLSTWIPERWYEENPSLSSTQTGLLKNVCNPQNGKQPTHSSISEGINKLWYAHMMEHHSAIKRNDLANYSKTWMNIKYILLSERSHSEKACLYHFIYMTFSKKQNYRDGKQIISFRDSAKGRLGEGWIGEV